MTINHMKRMMRAGSLAMMLAGALGLSIVTTSPAQGQAVPRQLPPEPPPELPSVSDYSLPPGDGQTPTDNQAQGPTDENTPPPQAAPTPGGAAPATQPTTRPVRVAPLPPSGTAAENRNPDQPAPAGSAQPSQRVNPAQRGTAARPPAGGSTTSAPPAETPAINNNQPEPGFTTDIPRPTSPAGPLATEASPSPTAPEMRSGGNILYYIGAGLVLLLLGGLGAYFWRRRTNTPLLEEEIADDPEPLPAADLAPTPRKPAPKIYSPPNPAEPKKPSPVSSDGFVTSKIGAISKPPSTPSAISPIAPTQMPKPKPSSDDRLQIEFMANGASSTLLNAVLNYTVTLTNLSDETFRDIRLSGAMMQANTENARNSSVQVGEVLHNIENLSAGEAVTLTGDIRLPLNAIRPITFKSQALFIPLARFGVACTDQNGAEYQQAASFIVGREYEPPRPKMAPFRLDLGPRIYDPVGQRPLNA